ncbi:nitroreductase [Tropicibacter oceani]|uniref:Nitroreductase n=1 Tax=Tropicibacter oceani TaxID=3058420 RepID=A0ABY8QM21_9RHOB|nr:nitroreductase [Tropicibacter oceani]WGW05056.1 nitroreductase [Tropicibacter oceani]
MTQSDCDALGAILRRRYSCRAFLPDPVPKPVIEAALGDAQHVPSWCNSQPWQVHVCGAEETERLRAALYEHVKTASHAPDIPFPQAYEGAYKDRRRECGWQLYDAVGVAKGDREASAQQMRENFRFFGAPHFLLITTPKKLGPYGVLDCGAYLTAVLLAFEARGIGAVPQAAVASYSGFMRNWFNVPEDRDVLVGASFGYADSAHPANNFRTTRADLAQVVDWR